MPTSQCNSAKMITVLKELFAEHGIPEEIRSDNEPSLQVISLQNSQRTGTLSTVHICQGTPGAMDKQSLQSRLSIIIIIIIIYFLYELYKYHCFLHIYMFNVSVPSFV